MRGHTLGALFALPILFAVAPSCVNPDSLGHGRTQDGPEASAGPLFIPPDGGEPELDDRAPLSMCVSAMCPAPYATCSASPTYKCETNLSNDVSNCGACKNNCDISLPVSLNMQWRCLESECQAVCQLHFLNCNGVPDDGCEVDPNVDPNNCGGCGVRCAPGERCQDRRCGCPPGTVDCNGKCVDLNFDDENCGACEIVCPRFPTDLATPPPHMYYGCENAHCGERKCCHGRKCDDTTLIWANCNGTFDDGCEIEISGTDRNNCGKCANECASDKACFALNGSIDCQCPSGYSVCGQSCADLESDPSNCGSCNYDCPAPPDDAAHTQRTCDRGRCGYECRPVLADCNQNAEDGCEVELSKDPHHCGACGLACDNAVGQPCVNGQCAMQECDAGGPTR